MGIFKRINDWNTSGDANSKPPQPPVLERLEPRILLSGDGLLYAATPDPLLDGTQPVVQYAELLETNEQVEQELRQDQDPSDTLETDLCQPLFILPGGDLAQDSDDLAVLTNESDEGTNEISETAAVIIAEEPVMNSSVASVEDGSMPIINSDADLSIEYATSIEIRGASNRCGRLSNYF